MCIIYIYIYIYMCNVYRLADHTGDHTEHPQPHLQTFTPFDSSEDVMHHRK